MSCGGCGGKTRGCGRRRRSFARPRLSSPGRARDRDEAAVRRRGSRTAPGLPAVPHGRDLPAGLLPGAPPRTPRRGVSMIERLTERVLAAFAASREIYGAPRIHAELQAQGERVGRKRVARLMRQAGIQGVTPPRSTPLHHAARRAGHAGARSARNAASWPTAPIGSGSPTSPTCRPARAGCSWPHHGRLEPPDRRLVDARRPQAELVVDALSMAVTRRQPQPGLIHHSDRGSQYTSLAYGRTLRDASCCPHGLAAATPTTTPPPRASSPPSSANSCTAPLHHPRPGPPGGLRLHRGLLQPPPPALEPRLHQPHRVREDERPPGVPTCRLEPRSHREPGQLQG